MARRRVYASAKFDRSGRFHAKSFGKVNHIRVVTHEFHTTQRHSLTLPTGDGGVKRSKVGREVLLEGRLVLRVVACQAIRNGTGHGLPSHRIEVDMRVP